MSRALHPNLRRGLTLATLFGVSFAAWSAGADLGQAAQAVAAVATAARPIRSRREVLIWRPPW